MAIRMTTALGTAAVLSVGVAHVQSGALTLGGLVLVRGYLAKMYDPLKTISRKAGGLQSHLASAERAFALLDQRPDVGDRPDARPLVRVVGTSEPRTQRGGVSGRPRIHCMDFTGCLGERNPPP